MILQKKESFQIRIFRYATEVLGFDDCRFTDLELAKSSAVYKEWLSQGFHGEMAYLEKHFPFKENPRLLLPGARSAVVVIKSYRNSLSRRLTQRFKIARYAVGKDYHEVMGKKLKRLEGFLKEQDPALECYSGVDSRPLSERSLALKAGIGFLGKNSMVIKPGLGSYFFIGVVLTDRDFTADASVKTDCGTCRLCIDACPTGAINENSTLNATKCLSYRTIERKTPLNDTEVETASGWIFGCDICQEVCPYNHGRKPMTDWEEFLPASGAGFDFFDRVADVKTGRKTPKNSPLKRAGERLWCNWERISSRYYGQDKNN